jgi:long-chain acyl-CoA synthetase
VPDAALGARPIAFVTADGTIDPAALARAIAAEVPYDLAPLTIRQVESFPMTPTGKIAKAELRQLASVSAPTPTATRSATR